MNQKWYDEFLKWNPKNFSNLEKIVVPANNIWTPDVVLLNSAKDLYNDQHMKYFRLEIDHEGKISYLPAGKMITTCPFDMTYFPFDEQTCRLQFGCWIPTCSEVMLYPVKRRLILDSYSENSEWKITNTDVKFERQVFSEETYCSVTVKIILKRKPLYFVGNVVLPCSLLSMISIVAFGVPAESGEKISLSMTTLLSYSVFLLVLTEVHFFYIYF